MYIRALLLGLAATLTSCGSPINHSYLRDDGTPLSTTDVTISVHHQTVSPQWRITYEFSEPTTGFVFIQSRAEMARRKIWKIEGEPGVDIEWQGAQDVVVRKDGSSFTKFTASFDLSEDFLHASVGDDSIKQFSDGSIALQTFLFLGGYQLKSLISARMLKVLPTFKFYPRAGEAVTVGNQSNRSELDFKDSIRSMGVYAYFGSIEAAKILDLNFIIDPQVAPEIRDLVTDTAGKTFALYTEKFGRLPFEPSILVTKTSEHSEMNSASGAAMWGQFVLNIHGSGKNLVEIEREIITNAVTHEMSHFWNALVYQAKWITEQKSLLFKDIKESYYDSWIWEGGAQALAMEARLALNLTPAARYTIVRSHLLDQCKEAIKTKRVIDAPTDGSLTWAPYHCGELLEYLVVDLAKRTKPDYSIFTLWKSIFAASPDKQLDNDVFFKAVRNDIPDISDEKIIALKKLLVTPADGLDALVDQIRK